MDAKVTTNQVEDAYQAFAATQKAARSDPALIENEYFKAVQDAAYARFVLLLGAL